MWFPDLLDGSRWIDFSGMSINQNHKELRVSYLKTYTTLLPFLDYI